MTNDASAAEPNPVGLPPRTDGRLEDPSTGDLNRARLVNLIGLVCPASNISMVWLSPKDLRWFGIGAGVVFMGLMFYASAVVELPWLAWTAAVAHYALVVLGLIHPRLPEVPARAWIGFGLLLGRWVPIPIFAAIYYLVLTPTALLVRTFGTDPLRRKAPPDESYWVDHEPPAKERYERQF